MHVVWLSLIFILAVSVDLFACGLAYGANGWHVPFRKIFLINIIGSMMIACGLVIGYYLRFIIADSVASWLGFGVFMAIGLFKFVQWLIELKKKSNKQLKIITWRESIILGVLLALDGMVAGIAAAMAYFSVAFIIIVVSVSLVTDPILFNLGQKLGQKLKQKANLNLGWLSCLIFFVLALTHIFI